MAQGTTTVCLLCTADGSPQVLFQGRCGHRTVCWRCNGIQLWSLSCRSCWWQLSSLGVLLSMLRLLAAGMLRAAILHACPCQQSCTLYGLPLAGWQGLNACLCLALGRGGESTISYVPLVEMLLLLDGNPPCSAGFCNCAWPHAVAEFRGTGHRGTCNSDSQLAQFYRCFSTSWAQEKR